jgi:hypothetical protein
MELFKREIGQAKVTPTGAGWRLEIPAGDQTRYRLAQLDDYVVTGRNRFLHKPPWEMRLRARASEAGLPGTWGFGIWNDPFGLSLGFGGTAWRIPALPQTAWFFHAGASNWLSLKDDGTPGDGFFAGTFRSLRLPTGFFLAGAPAIPFLAWRLTSRLLRRLAARFIRQQGHPVETDVIQWHEYSIVWQAEKCIFSVDGVEVLRTTLAPPSPLGLVIWIDNQYARWTPEGRIGYGTLANPAAWIEVEDLIVE